MSILTPEICRPAYDHLAGESSQISKKKKKRNKNRNKKKGAAAAVAPNEENQSLFEGRLG